MENLGYENFNSLLNLSTLGIVTLFYFLKLAVYFIVKVVTWLMPKYKTERVDK